MEKRGSCKTGQVTIFIIIGIVLLIVVGLTIQLTGDVQKHNFQSQRSDIFNTIFTKEALRILVDECLQQGVEEGLELIGRQGRLWAVQPGGLPSNTFQPSINGKIIDGENIYYAITHDLGKYPIMDVQAYPCDDSTNSPSYCRYHYPPVTFENPGEGNFGRISLLRTDILNDLQRYLSQRAVTCVEEFLTSEIPGASNIITLSSSVIQLRHAEDNIMKFEVNYPLKLVVEGKEFFHVSKFDFTYSSQFVKLLKTIVDFPLRQDQDFVDFGFTWNTLTDLSGKFSYASHDSNCNNGLCERTTRVAEMNALSVRLDVDGDVDGDDLYTFRVPKDKIIEGGSGDYVFRVLRQNRPPALDYVERLSCPDLDYDYLVVPGVVGTLNTPISQNALNPTMVVSFNDGSVTTDPSNNAMNALRDDDATFVSLGQNGKLTLSFDVNLFVNDGTPLPDLKISENGDDESYRVRISKDNYIWFYLNEYTGSVDIDLDSFNIRPQDGFRYIELVDSGGNTYGQNPGADISVITGIFGVNGQSNVPSTFGAPVNLHVTPTPSLGEFSIELTAKDPDEDNEESYELIYNIVDGGNNPVLLNPANGRNQYYLAANQFGTNNRIIPGNYEIRGTVNDQTNGVDSQIIKVKVEEPLETTITLSNPDSVLNRLYMPVVQVGDTYAVSREDPFCADVNPLAGSPTRNREVLISLKYSSRDTPGFNMQLPTSYPPSILMPHTTISDNLKICDLGRYSDPGYITDFNYAFQIHNPSNLINPNSLSTIDEGTFAIQANANLCERDLLVNANEIKVNVKGCYPHVNEEYPFAYPNNRYKLVNGDFGDDAFRVFNQYELENSPINPFLATHSCCEGNPQFPDGDTTDPNDQGWKVKVENEVCSRRPGCFDVTENRPDGFVKGYVLTEEVKLCDGNRGNVCGTDPEYTKFMLPQVQFCGINSDNTGPPSSWNDVEPFNTFNGGIVSCNDIADECQGIPRYGKIVLRGDTDVLCHGTMGCSEVNRNLRGTDDEGTQAVVLKSDGDDNVDGINPPPITGDIEPGGYYYTLAKQNNYFNDQDFEHFDFNGCASHENSPCDSNYDGSFSGMCQSDTCSGDSGSSDSIPRLCTVDDYTCRLDPISRCGENGMHNLICQLIISGSCRDTDNIDPSISMSTIPCTPPPISGQPYISRECTQNEAITTGCFCNGGRTTIGIRCQ
jgi:hypothetical protein